MVMMMMLVMPSPPPPASVVCHMTMVFGGRSRGQRARREKTQGDDSEKAVPDFHGRME